MSGGAGLFVRSLHLNMLKLGIPSLLVTRESVDVKSVVVVNPLSRVQKTLRARRLAIFGKLGLIDRRYATFGIEGVATTPGEIQSALGAVAPKAFIFYWVSGFVSFECMFKLRQAYPGLPFLFVCLDDGFLGGGCHYSWGCNGYEDLCHNCPSTILSHRKRRIERELCRRANLIHAIDPMVLYPTTTMQRMGEKSAVLKSLRSTVLPLGAVSNEELQSGVLAANRRASGAGMATRRLTLLVRSSSEYRKGCDLFIAAVRALGMRLPNLRERLKVFSVGDATLKNSGIESYLDHEFMGMVQRSELMAIYEHVDALIVTSREDAGPLMINECIALGKFAISTSVGVATDLIEEGQNGFIVRDFTSEAVEDALLMFLERCPSGRPTTLRGPSSEVDGNRLTFEGYIGSVMKMVETGI